MIAVLASIGCTTGILALILAIRREILNWRARRVYEQTVAEMRQEWKGETKKRWARESKKAN